MIATSEPGTGVIQRHRSSSGSAIAVMSSYSGLVDTSRPPGVDTGGTAAARSTRWATRSTHGHPVSRYLRRRRPGAMRSVAANGTVTVAGQQLRVGRTYGGQTVAISTDDTVFRVLHNDV